MKAHLSVGLLKFLADALQKPMSKRENGLYSSVLRHAEREGWVSFADIEDIICETDPRLYGINTADFASASEIPVRSFFPRPRQADKTVLGYTGFAVPDAAALLISLRRLGFSIDPQPLVDLALPAIRSRSHLTESELSVFWFNKEKDRFSGFSIGAIDDRPRDLTITEFVTETGYRIELCSNQDGNPWLLSVQSPKRRRRSVVV
jgi:hypothetical protein